MRTTKQRSRVEKPSATKKGNVRARAAALKPKPSEISAGVIGLGLMGTSIVACLLAAGHRVTAVTRNAAKHKRAKGHTLALLREMQKEGFLRSDPARLVKNFSISEDVSDLQDCGVVVESIIEDIDTKKDYLRRVEETVSPEALIGSNTSSIPVTLLQKSALHPERILGIHWAEPAHITRFMEIIQGEQTDPANAERALALARAWGKEPTYVQRDIRGFITNRVFYAMLREAFYLVENGYATPADVDRSVRNDLGWWITLAGPFRFMDLTGIPAYQAVMRDLFPELNNQTTVPPLMDKVVKSGGRGVQNANGFYDYTPEQAKKWEKAFLRFTYDVRRLAMKYSKLQDES
jgi:3-hydroxybutyryl-CoA dehydrogenase